MNDKKNILLHLYGDPDAEGDLRSSLKSKEHRLEHQALSEARFKLDFLPGQKPEPATINAIVNKARQAAESAVPGRRQDRPPMWRSRSLRRVLIPALSMAAMVVFAIGVGLFSTENIDQGVLDASIGRADKAITPAESLLRPTPVPPSFAEQLATYDADPELAWDDARDVRQLYRRIESLIPENELDWDERTIPLELIPNQTAAGRQVQRASSPRR